MATCWSGQWLKMFLGPDYIKVVFLSESLFNAQFKVCYICSE